MHSCNNIIFDFIKSKIPKNSKLYIPTIENQMGTKSEDYNLFCKEKYYKILNEAIPRRYPGQIMKNKKKKLSEEEKEKIYKINKTNIDNILSRDKSNEFLNLINITFGEYLETYLNDKKIIIINKININLEGFKTFGECFNEGNDFYPPKLKEKCKQSLLNIMHGKYETEEL